MIFHKLERLINLTEGYQQRFNIDGQAVLLLHENGQNYILLDRCPHQQKSFGANCLRQGTIHCQAHGMQFDISTGKNLVNNPNISTGSLTKYQAAYEGQFIGIYLQH